MIGKLLISALALAAVPLTPAGAAMQASASSGQSYDWQLLFKDYPPEALARGEQGSVGFKVSLDADGNPTECEVTKRSGYASLDNGTCRLILDRASFKGVRDVNGKKVGAQYAGVVDWKLPNAKPAAQPVLASADAPEKLICKRQLRTGSLVGTERRCFTKTQWQRMAEQTRSEWQELQGSKGSSSGH